MNKETENEWQEREIKISEPLRKLVTTQMELEDSISNETSLAEKQILIPLWVIWYLKDEDTFWGLCCYAISLLYKHHKVSLHKCR